MIPARRFLWTAMLGLGAVVALLCYAPPTFGQNGIPSKEDEYLIKAAFLYGFGQNVTWPDSSFDSPKAPFVIGILGSDPFGGALQEIARKKTIQGRKIVIRQFARIENYQGPCHILFISDAVRPEEQHAALRQLSQVGLLTVGESPDFIAEGGIVDLYLEGDSVRFELNVEAANRAKLRMDAQLQKLSKPAADRRTGERASPATLPSAAAGVTFGKMS
ncbi:MAG: YfiR family protein [Pirellulales bacterium]|nr:YfiR family protein [Pirellulales bacterium]